MVRIILMVQTEVLVEVTVILAQVDLELERLDKVVMVELKVQPVLILEVEVEVRELLEQMDLALKVELVELVELMLILEVCFL